MAKNLIVYYSRADENYVGGVLKQLEVGNTEVAAGIINELIDADMFKIQQQQEYPKSYNECIAVAQEDQRKGARPALKAFPESIEQYDTIYLGYPNYWSTMPMAVFTFLEHFDFTSKTIKPFCTHEGSGMGVSERDIKNICKGAVVKKGFAIRGSGVKNAKKDIERWIKE